MVQPCGQRLHFQPKNTQNVSENVSSLICKSSLNMCKWVQKLGNGAQIWKTLDNTLEVTFKAQISWFFFQKWCLMISRTNYKIGHLESKTMSQGKSMEKPCKLSRRHNLSLNVLEICQRGCFMAFRSNANIGHLESKLGRRTKIWKKLVKMLEAIFSAQISLKFSIMLGYMTFFIKFEYESFWIRSQVKGPNYRKPL